MAGILYAAIAWLPGFAQNLTFGWMQKEFTDRPPGEGFAFVFKRPPPSGVAEIRVAGETWLAGTDVWLRFRANPASLGTLMPGWSRKRATADSIGNIRVWDSTLAHYDPDNRLRWSDVYAARNLIEYSQSDGSGGSVTAWVDSKTGDVFVMKFGI